MISTRASFIATTTEAGGKTETVGEAANLCVTVEALLAEVAMTVATLQLLHGERMHCHLASRGTSHRTSDSLSRTSCLTRHLASWELRCNNVMPQYNPRLRLHLPRRQSHRRVVLVHIEVEQRTGEQHHQLHHVQSVLLAMGKQLS